MFNLNTFVLIETIENFCQNCDRKKKYIYNTQLKKFTL